MRGSLSETLRHRLQVEQSQISLIGARETNQDRVGVEVTAHAVLAVVCDGMGGHSDGERAATIGERVIRERFREVSKPLLDPLGFLHLALSEAHTQVVEYGGLVPFEVRPRATCAVCLIQDGAAYWAHAGDSRVYLFRESRMVKRTRDHSHVELLLREGLISADEIHGHPMRNFVESCIGGEALIPEMSLGLREPLLPGDTIMLCSDGLWAQVPDDDMARILGNPQLPLSAGLSALAERAVQTAGNSADNTSAVAVRFLGLK
jgi:serine/threonine protein phosphatase PrpC